MKEIENLTNFSKYKPTQEQFMQPNLNSFKHRRKSEELIVVQT